MPEITVEFETETLEALEERAAEAHEGDRSEAAAAMLESWLVERRG